MKNSKKAITGGMLFINGTLSPGTLLIDGQTIESIKQQHECPPHGYEIINAANCIVSYGFIDPHVHFRMPGAPHKEDWKSGSKAAIHGGFTFVIDMPNNNPSATSLDVLIQKQELAEESLVNFGFYLGLTSQNSTECLRIIDQARSQNIPVYGIKAFLGSSTGNLLVTDSQVVTDALASGEVVLFHCEDHNYLSAINQVPFKRLSDHHNNRPAHAEALSIKSICQSADKIKDTARIYICHLSSQEGIDAVERYRADDFTIFSEATPHHLYFSLEKLIELEPQSFAKCNPPIRPESDRLAIINKFAGNLFNCVGSDHAPHLISEKMSENPPSGMPGLETSFYVLCSLYDQGILNMEQVLQHLTSAYSIFNITDRGTLQPGNRADITIIKKRHFTYQHVDSFTKADFSPFNKRLSASHSIEMVLIDGEIRLQNGQII